MMRFKAVPSDVKYMNEMLPCVEYYEAEVDGDDIHFIRPATEVERQHGLGSIPKIAREAVAGGELYFAGECMTCGAGWKVTTNGHFGRWEMVKNIGVCPVCFPEKTEGKEDFDSEGILCVICGEPLGKKLGWYRVKERWALHDDCFKDLEWGAVKCGFCLRPVKDNASVHVASIDNEPLVVHDECFHDFRKRSYDFYIGSVEWKVRADKCKERAGGKCQICNSSSNLHAHHRTYDNLGNEKDEDLICLCQTCHELFSKNGRLAK